jgi:hypothetical protein
LAAQKMWFTRRNSKIDRGVDDIRRVEQHDSRTLSSTHCHILTCCLGDLCLKKWRKGRALSEIFEPYGVEDYRGLFEEWMEVPVYDTACARGDIASESSDLRKRMNGVMKNLTFLRR